MSRQVDSNIFEKKPQSLKDFSINWGDYWLGSDTISTSEWTVPSGLDNVTDTNDDDTATIWISGGVVGQTYQLINQIVTAGGRIERDSIYIRIIGDDD